MKNIVKRNLRYYRIKKGLSQYELANKLNISRSLVAYWELGKVNISIDHVEAIANVLDIPIRDLFKEELEDEDENKDVQVNNLKEILINNKIINEKQVFTYYEFDKIIDFIGRNIDLIIDKKSYFSKK